MTAQAALTDTATTTTGSAPGGDSASFIDPKGAAEESTSQEATQAKDTSTETEPPADGKSEAAGLVDGFGAKESEGEKTEETSAATEQEKESLSITLPEGVEYDPKDIEEFRAFASEHLSLTSEDASKLAAWQAQRVQEANSASMGAQVAHAKEQTAQWAQEIRQHPDLGGDKFEESQVVARKGFRHFGGEKMAELLIELSGGRERWDKGEAYDLSQHPVFFEMFHKLGKALGEDTSGGGAPSGSKRTESERLRSIYNHPTSELARKQRGF